MSGHNVTRRRFLRGAASASLLLPVLPSLFPRQAQAASGPPRLLVYYLPNGRRAEWWVPIAGESLTFPGQAAALQPFADRCLSVLNLSNTAALGSPGAAHAMGTGTVLTCSTIPDIGGGVLHNDVSIDQLVASQLAPDTLFSSLQWSSGEPGPCDVGGASCAYTQSVSWTGPASPLVPTIDPAVAFERLFGGGADGLTGLAGDIRRQSKRSILDFVEEDATAVQTKVGTADAARLDEYFTAVRELEKTLDTAALSCAMDPMAPAGGLGYPERVAAYNDMIALALSCDVTRIMSFMIEFGLSGRSHDFLDAPGSHHGLSHYGDDLGRARLEKVETWQAQQLGALLQKLVDTPDAEGGNLLDNTLVLAIGSMGEGSSHDHGHNSPLLFGGSSIVQTTGKQIGYAAGTPGRLADLHVSILRAYGIEGSFGANGSVFGDDGQAVIDGFLV